MSTIINGESDLYALADGTLITWLRIPSDPTSHAVAFVNIETSEHSDDPEPMTLWISPGGWMPMSAQGADITYPCVALGTLQEIVDEQNTLNRLVNDVQPFTPPEVHTLDVGGSWPSLRVEALKAAATVWTTSTGRRFQPSDVLDTAGDFLTWLSRDPLADAMNDVVESEPTPRYLSDVEWFNDSRTRTLFHILREALSGDDPARAVTNAVGILDHWTAVTPPADG